MEEKKISYEEATTQIEEILTKLRNNEISIDELTSQVARATELIKLCRTRLTTSEEELKRILDL